MGNFGLCGKMDKCIFCVGGLEENNFIVEFVKYGCNCIVEGKLLICVEMCLIKVLLVGDGDVVVNIYCEWVVVCGFGFGVWGWGLVYG